MLSIWAHCILDYKIWACEEAQAGAEGQAHAHKQQLEHDHERVITVALAGFNIP